MLGDYGADVIKIERPPTGDLSRTSIPDDPGPGSSGPVYCSLNRNKRSVVLDLRKPEERTALMELIRGADVVVNNFRAGVMERMGLGYDELKKINARLIYAVGTGFGLTGPYAHKGGQDVLAQAMSGVMARVRARAIRSRSTRRLSRTIRPACIWCRRAACTAAAGEDRPRAAVQRVAARLDDRARRRRKPRRR
jgi:crotonobetainyl-CoA:carnitine CoA-transferase CaiB-like acyl-CoA transferase